MSAAILPWIMQDGRTVPTPQVHALILEALQLQPGQKVLEVGSGSGTTARVLAGGLCKCDCQGCWCDTTYKVQAIELTYPFGMHCGSDECRQGLEVHTIELQPIYGEVLNHDALDVYFHAGDGKFGLKEEAPFDAIVATCGCEQLPTAWNDQLKEGGKLVAPVGSPAAQRLILFQKVSGVLVAQKVLAYVRFSVMR